MARMRVSLGRGFELKKIPGGSAGATGRRTNVTDDHRSDFSGVYQLMHH
jgi:hypothetical protein